MHTFDVQLEGSLVACPVGTFVASLVHDLVMHSFLVLLKQCSSACLVETFITFLVFDAIMYNFLMLLQLLSITGLERTFITVPIEPQKVQVEVKMCFFLILRVSVMD